MKSGWIGSFLSMMPCTRTCKANGDSSSQARPRVDQCCSFLRSFGVGLMGVVLGIYLFRTGLTSTAIGSIIAAGLAGSACATVIMTIAADQGGRKWFLAVLSLLSAVGGIALALTPSLPLATLTFIGMLNGIGTDRSAAFALDQA